jgi:hypothetical protein
MSDSKETIALLAKMVEQGAEREERLIAALDRIGKPPPEPTAEDRAKKQADFLSYRKGGPPLYPFVRSGSVPFADPSSHGIHRMHIGSITLVRRHDGKTVCVEVGDLDMAPHEARKMAEFDKANAEFIKESLTSASQAAELIVKRRLFWSRQQWMAVRRPVVNACVGKTLEELEQFVTFDAEPVDAASPVATDTITPPAPPTEDGAPVVFDLPERGSKRLESLVAK